MLLLPCDHYSVSFTMLQLWCCHYIVVVTMLSLQWCCYNVTVARVMRAREIRPDIAAWAFRLEHSQDSSRQRYFACSSEHEMQVGSEHWCHSFSCV